MRAALRSVGWYLAATAMIIVGLGVGVLVWSQHTGLETLHVSIAAAGPWLLAWRLALISGAIGLWLPLVNGCARLGGWSNSQVQCALALRWRAALWLLCCELIIIDNVIGHVINLLQTRID